jgi:hypothetical protein
MPLVIADRVLETTSTTGTGTITLAGAVTGYQSFGTAIGDGNTTYYTIAIEGGTDWEVGIGTYTASGTTLSRDTVLASSNSGSLVSFGSGTKNVFVTYPGGKAVYYQAAGGVVISDNSTANALRITQTGTGNALVVEDSANPDATPFVVDANGRVIAGGTTVYAVNTITGKIQSQSTSVFDGGFASTLWSADNQPNFWSFGKSRGASVGTQTIVNNADAIGVIQFAGSDGTTFVEAARITAAVDGTPGTNDMPGRLVFSTTADGASTPTERMRINSAGAVGIGTSSLTGINLAVAKNITGATTSFGVRSAGQIQTDVTSQARMFDSSPTLASGSFTLNTLYHYFTSQGTVGGATVTNQIGYFAESTLTGATNNYGFYSNIASGTGRWNFYANGTADNYFGGNTIINGAVGVGAAGSPSYGTSGQTLTSRGSAAAPVWSNPGIISALVFGL